MVLTRSTSAARVPGSEGPIVGVSSVILFANISYNVVTSLKLFRRTTYILYVIPSWNQ